MIQVKDGNRLLEFDGQLISESSSRRRGQSRWVEFRLYKTHKEGRYILSRVGKSTLYHVNDCEVVQRNKLKDAPRSELEQYAEPCDECQPDRFNTPIVCPEKPRHWAQVCDTPEAVIKALTKEDDAGNQYLTFVARRLLEEASDADTDLASLYRVQTIY